MSRRDNFLSIASEVRTQTTLDIELCKILVRDTFRELHESYSLWSWLLKRGVLTLAAPYSTGLATTTQFNNKVAFSGSTLSTTMVGLQFRLGIGDPFYTITFVDPNASPPYVLLDKPWADTSQSGVAFTIIQAYITPPDDFFSWLVVSNPLNEWRLNLNIPQSLLDWWDPKRAATGTPLLLSPVDYAPSYAGKVYQPIRIVGSSPIPSANGMYSGATDSIFTIQITGNGALDAATFQWKKDDGAFSSNQTVSSSGNSLQDQLGLTWSSGNYVNGDIFLIRVSAIQNPGLPRYEVYPYPSQQLVFPFHYASRYPDLSDTNVDIPRFVPGNFIKEGALAKAARIPGTDAQPNPYSQIARAESHENRFQQFISLLVQQDAEVFANEIGTDAGLPYAPLPWASNILGGRPQNYDPLYIYAGVYGV